MVTTSPDPAPATPPGTMPVDGSNRQAGPVSLRGPALVVLGIAVFILIAGIVASALASGRAPAVSLRSVSVRGGVVPLTPATIAMKPIVGASEPPADVIGNLVVPAGSTMSHVVNLDQGQGQFDRTVYFTTRLTSDQVVETYRAALPRLGWRVLYVGAGSGRSGTPGTEVLAKLGSGDGFYWEVGAVASPTTPGGVTPFSVEVFELPDDS